MRISDWSSDVCSSDLQVARFTVDVGMTVELRDARGFRIATATSSAKRSNTIGEKATLNDRDKLLYDLVKATMMDVDRELESNIQIGRASCRERVCPYV